MGSPRAVFIENGPNNDGVYLKIKDGVAQIAATEADRVKQDRVIALLEAILEELKKR